MEYNILEAITVSKDNWHSTSTRYTLTIVIIIIALSLVNACHRREEEAETDSAPTVTTAVTVAKALEHFNKGVQYSMKDQYAEAITE